MSSFWKIKHKETGLFYKPAGDYPKNSLSKKGKVYHKKPSLLHINHGYHRIIDKKSYFIKTSDWTDHQKFDWTGEIFEIVEFKVLENG